MILLLEHANGTLKSVNGLTVVLVGGVIVCLLNFTNFGCCLHITLPHRDVIVKLGDLLGQRGCIGSVLLDVCLENLNGLLGLRDGTLLLDRSVITELLVRSKLDLFFILLLLALFQHAVHHLDHLLHWCDGMSRNSESSNRNDALHCDPGAQKKSHWRLEQT